MSQRGVSADAERLFVLYKAQVSSLQGREMQEGLVMEDLGLPEILITHELAKRLNLLSKRVGILYLCLGDLH